MIGARGLRNEDATAKILRRVRFTEILVVRTLGPPERTSQGQTFVCLKREDALSESLHWTNFHNGTVASAYLYEEVKTAK